MGFGSGSSKSPIEEDEDGSSEETNRSRKIDTKETTTDAHDSTNRSGSETIHSEEPQQATPRQNRENGQDSNQNPPATNTTPKKISEININNRHTTEEMAEMLMAEAYHEEDPGVPYSMWRENTTTARNGITVKLNPEIDKLVIDAQREFSNKYDAYINKSDLREFAIVFGLLHTDELFEIAEEWGLQYNS